MPPMQQNNVLGTNVRLLVMRGSVSHTSPPAPPLAFPIRERMLIDTFRRRISCCRSS